MNDVIPSAAAPETDRPASSIACRLCDAPAAAVFSLKLIGEHDVRYYRCSHCGSLQTEPPYWLDEAYANSNLAMLDTGVAQRNMTNLAAIYAWVRLAQSRTVVDIGGGDGLLCRLLRDYGIDARLEDRYAANTYAQGFDGDQRHSPVTYTAFEVLEHYADPARDLAMVFGPAPDSIVVTTALYDAQGPDWWYLTPDSGQHVFFYTRKAMEIIAARFGYTVDFMGNYTVFVKGHRLGAMRMAIAKFAMSAVGSRLLRSFIMLLPARGAIADYERIARRNG